MENSTLNITLEQAIKQTQQLNSNLAEVNNTAKELSSTNAGMNLSFQTMNQAIQNLGSAVPGVTSAFQMYKTAQEQVNVAAKAFAANPVGAALQIIATVLAVVNTIIDTFKSKIAESDEATAKWNEVLAAFDPIMKAANAVISIMVDQFIKIAGVVAEGVKWVGKFGDSVSKFFGGSGKAYQKAAADAQKYAKLQNQINKDERERIKERAESDAKQGKLREQIAQAEGENKKKLLIALRDEIKLQTDAEIALNNKRIALMKYQQSLGPTSTAEKKALAELEAENNRLIGEQGRQLARIEKQIKATTTSTSNHVKKTAKSTTDKALEEAKRYADQLKKVLDTAQKSYSNSQTLLDAQRKLEDEQLKLAGATQTEILTIKKLRLAKDLLAETKYYEERKKLLNQYINDDKLSEKERSDYKNELADLELEHKKNALNYETDATKLAYEEQSKIQKNIDKEGDEMRKRMATQVAENDKAMQESAQSRFDVLREQMYANMQLAAMATQETFDLINEQFTSLSGPQASIINGLGQVADAFLDMDKEAGKGKNAMKVVGAAMQAATSIINQYMQAKQSQIQQDLESGKITEKEAKKQFEKTKKVQIAMATISMAQGIAEAISKAMTLGPIAGPIIGALNAAAVSAAGIMQIKNIKKTTLESPDAGADSSSIGQLGTVADYGPGVSPLLDEGFDAAQLNTTTSTTGDSATKNQRVYILESDIQDSNKRVEIRESNTTF